MLSRYASPSNISSAFGRGYGAAAIGLSISVVSKRGCLPSLGYLVHDIADVDGGFSQPAQCYEALDFWRSIFPAVYFLPPAATILRINSRSVGSSGGVTISSPSAQSIPNDAQCRTMPRAPISRISAKVILVGRSGIALIIPPIRPRVKAPPLAALSTGLCTWL